MPKSQDLANVAANLRTLCRSFSSVADVCRRIGINRQQFNKYLAGDHYPSNRNLSSIARFFSIDEKDLLMESSAFERFFEGVQFDISWEVRSSPQFLKFLPLLRSSCESMRAYNGVYFRYHNSSLYKGRILRSITYIYEKNSLAQYVTIERFQSLGDGRKTESTFKYQGFCVALGDRIFLVDLETRQKNELTFSILACPHRNVLRFLYGTLSGVAATSFRQPFATKMVLEFKRKGDIEKADLMQLGALLPSDQSLPIQVRDYLAGGNSSIVWGGES